MKKVAVIGCGAIGRLIAQSFAEGQIHCDEILLYDKDIEKARKVKSEFKAAITPVSSVDEIVKVSPQIIVEAASQQAVREYLPKLLSSDAEIVIMSVGALLDTDVESEKIHVPSGAIGGLDAISSATIAGIQTVSLKTRKNPATLGLNDKSERVVYHGTALEAVRLFPREMNVAATLALAVRPHKVDVRVVSDPKTIRNIHEVKVDWKFGTMFLMFENDPHPQNPGTSALAAYSAINLVKELLKKF